MRVRDLLKSTNDPIFTSILEAQDGKQALQLLENMEQDQLPHIIVLDRNMPVMSGDVCIRIIKSDPIWLTIPIIFLTAQADKLEVVKGLTRLGCDDYLSKPFDPGELLARVRVLVRAKMAEDRSRVLSLNLERARVEQKNSFDQLRITKVKLAESEAIAQMTRIFEKFVPKKFLERVAVGGIENIRAGNVQSMNITTLFSDIRSFTSFSEHLSPAALFEFLNEYLAEMQLPIDEHDGFVDKFIGDAIMALFDQDGPVQAAAATRAAIGMQRRLARWNGVRSGGPQLPIVTGIGIHTGSVMLGTLGSSTRIDSTVIGDAVNLASRLESLTKYYGVSIMVSSDTKDLLDATEFETRELDFVSVKGRAAPVSVHEIYQHLEGENLMRHRLLSQIFSEARKLYMVREWEKASYLFLDCLKIDSSDATSKVLIGRCKYYMETPPPHEWDGSFVMTSK